jgi:hypothetical protein
MLNIISFLEILLRFRMISQKYVSLLGLSKIIRNNSKLTFVGFPDARPPARQESFHQPRRFDQTQDWTTWYHS